MRCLEKSRDDRYQQASEMRADLMRLKRDTDSGRASAGVDANSSAQLAAAARAHRMRLWLWLGAAAAALLLAWFLRPALPPPEVTGTRELTHDSAPKTSWEICSRCRAMAREFTFPSKALPDSDCLRYPPTAATRST
jgi:hypothetical protein